MLGFWAHGCRALVEVHRAYVVCSAGSAAWEFGLAGRTEIVYSAFEEVWCFFSESCRSKDENLCRFRAFRGTWEH